MAKLYFRYGAMGASKTANALMVRCNYEERGQCALMVKPMLDQRDGERIIQTRIGLSHPCIWMEDLQQMDSTAIQEYQCIIVDEAQFLTKEQVLFLSDIVDLLDVPVMCYGLRADFRGDLFEGSNALFSLADDISEIKTICWCGKKATFNARFDANGVVTKTGEQVVLGSNDRYTVLCRKHWKEGNLGPKDEHA